MTIGNIPNAGGVRTGRTVTKGSTTEKHSYVYASGKLLRDTVESGGSTKILDFRYDQSGAPYSLTYTVGSTSTVYYYVTNLQGDVMYLVDSSGNQVAAYLYDPFGKVLSSSGTMAEINPLRYRGYYQDNETGFYYLQSRYYDPAICRFINADSYASTGQGLIGYHMFVYCNNNPINRIDTNGLWTAGLSLSANGVFGFGISASIGFVFDGNGNFDWQYSYVVPGVDDTSMLGIFGISISLSAQYTKADTVYDLYGPATYVGASGGPFWFIGGDMVSFSDASDMNSTFDGVQVVGGVGVGVDVHVTESYTKSITKGTQRPTTQNTPKQIHSRKNLKKSSKREIHAVTFY